MRAGPADAVTASALRDDLNGWLRQVVRVTPGLRNDIILSVYEALVNCVDHAYQHRNRGGAMRMHAVYDRAIAAVSVSVSDRGAWHGAPSTSAPQNRGRGIALMRALADRCVIEARPSGTIVRLHYCKQ